MRNFRNAARPKHLILVSVEALRRLRLEPEIPRYLCVSGARKPAKITRSKVETAPAIGTPEFSCNANDKLFARNIVQNDKACALEPPT
jgi:hypothetical protein